MRKRRKIPEDFKAKVALAAIKGDLTLSEICSQFEVQSPQVTAWKKELIENAAEIFSGKHSHEKKHFENERDTLFNQIGKLKVENDFLRKKLMP